MRLENDNVFNELYEEEFNKIPFLFRFSRKRFKVVIITTIVLFASMLILTSVFYSTGKSEVIAAPISPLTTGSQMVVNMYNNGVLVAVIIVAAIVVLLALWMFIAKQFEKRAFSKATKLANMIYLSERHKQAVDWSNWKMQNRDY